MFQMMGNFWKKAKLALEHRRELNWNPACQHAVTELGNLFSFFPLLFPQAPTPVLACCWALERRGASCEPGIHSRGSEQFEGFLALPLHAVSRGTVPALAARRGVGAGAGGQRARCRAEMHLQNQ